jgi:hypothetical protein
MLTSSPTLDHVIISGNISTVYGGGFDYRTSSYPTIINSIITENDCIGEPGYCNTNAFSGGGQGSILTVINSIIRDNGDPSDINNPLNGEFGITSNNFNANYSILPDSIYLWPDKIGLADFEEMEDIIGVGNIIEDPLFVDPDNGDYSLSWENYPDQDSTMSPCIDAGTADLDGDGEDDIEYVGAAPDMGAFEYGALPAVTGFMFYTFDTYISLTWDPANQDGFQYYLLERSTDEEFAEDVVSNELVSNYYEDDSLEYDTEYFYRVSYYAGVQQSYYSEVLSVTLQWLDVDGEKLPTVYAIHQNYPNPFNPTTQIKYDLPEDAMVSITIYDIMGRSIKSLVNSNQSAGYRSIQWNATNNLGEPVSAGLYLYTIDAGKFRQTKKMVLLK